VTNRDQDIIETEIQSSPAVLSMLHASEIDMQIATAHKFPRSIAQFRKDVFDMVAISEAVAAECTYALPRDGKMIEGPSARFAEIIASAWGNARAGARVVDEGPQFITSQGVFHDLQKNVAITFEVQRRITNKYGKRYNEDMVVTTGNAASSIALRNAVLKGIPKAFWSEMWDQARKVALGDSKTLPTRRAEAFAAAQRFGVTKEQVCAKLGAKGEQDVGLEALALLRSILTAIKEGDTTAEQAFSLDEDKVIVPMPTRASQQKPDSTPGTPVQTVPATGGAGGTGSTASEGATAGGPPWSDQPALDPFVADMNKAEQKQTQRPDPETGEVPPPASAGPLASAGEVANIKLRAEAAGVSLDTLLTTMKMAYLLPDLRGLTKEDFKLLKTKLS
jgi:hypothetical protein